ncbi:CAP domain-containing protein [Lactobacillaceae bacterium Melli_B4]
MKKINARIYRSLATVAIAAGTIAGLTTTVQAKKQAKQPTIKKITKYPHQYTVKPITSKGYIYKSYKLKNKVASLKKFKNATFTTRYVYSIKLANGDYVLVNKVSSAKQSGFILTTDLKKVANNKKVPTKSASQGTDQTTDDATQNKNDNDTPQTNNNSSNNVSSNSSSTSTDFTAQDMDQINQYKEQAQAIGNGASSQDIYRSQPVISDTFAPGQLNSTYIQNSVDWINFFRKMVGQQAVFNNTGWNQDAQYGAAMLAASNNANNSNTLSHGLVDFTKPAFISDSDWQRGADATNDSNISSGIDSPYDVVTNFLNDGFNVNPAEGPGHRQWLLGNIDQIGIGKAGDYNDYKIFADNSSNSYTDQQPVNFPGSGVFPIDLVQNTVWSISLPNGYNGATPMVSVHDNTANADVSVSGVNASGTTTDSQGLTTFGYGYFGTNVWFTPDASAIKVNHSYTITVNGLPGMSSPYQYTTKLFDLGITSNN